ncbi:mitochondrial potassium channel-like [Actinia tenebrosa]|uniref:Mitochondrial potassium channel-like n=1 Tax=Actinia tenebrosa TaxID=6105 RepID=A0A6P8IV63_ACTTE|nr:mitochondrial potassium channel-like [Actinia tenebrosa]
MRSDSVPICLLFKMLMFQRVRTRNIIFSVNRYSLRSGQRLIADASDKSNPEGPKNGNTAKKLLQKMSNTFNAIPSTIQEKSEKITKASLNKISGSISAFDDLLGITEVRNAQSKVREAENRFMDLRKQVQQAEKELELVRAHLNDVRKRLDRVSRDDERYLSLATEEHETLLEEKKLKASHAELESQERDHFALLSGIVRESHEKERQRAERTKHWSVIGSLVGATLGVISSSLINYLRLKEVKSSVKGTGEELMEKTTELLNILTSQDSKLAANSSELKEAFAAQNKEVTDKLEDVREAIDTYALSASIGSDVGTIESGISLKTLTSQLRELVQLQLAAERERVERKADSATSDFSTDLQSEIKEIKEENRKIYEELNLGIETINKKIGSQSGNEISLEEKNVDAITEVSMKEKYYESVARAEYWSKAQTIGSIASIVASTLVLIYEISK